jgi:hypothetical protein
MKKKFLSLSLIIITLIVLTGCQSSPSTNPAPAEISTVEDVVGLWWRPYEPLEAKYWWKVNKDGTFRVCSLPNSMEDQVASRLEKNPLDKGELWFEGTTLNILSQGESEPATYKVQRQENGELKFEVIQDWNNTRKTVITDELWQKAP